MLLQGDIAAVGQPCCQQLGSSSVSLRCRIPKDFGDRFPRLFPGRLQHRKLLGILWILTTRSHGHPFSHFGMPLLFLSVVSGIFMLSDRTGSVVSPAFCPFHTSSKTSTSHWRHQKAALGGQLRFSHWNQHIRELELSQNSKQTRSNTFNSLFTSLLPWLLRGGQFSCSHGKQN